MPDIERYTPSQMEEEIQDLAEKYVSAVDELETDTEIFEDISEAIQSKTGQIEPYEKDELAGAIDGIVVDPNANLDAYIQGDLTDIVFNGTTIQAYTFRGTGITSISMPNVTQIRNGAFYDCTLLELSSLPSNLITMEANAFRNASKINFNYFPDNVTILPSYSFSGCNSLSNIIMPRNFSNFGDSCFAGCTNLLTVDMSMVENLATVATTSFNNTTCTFLFRDQAQLNAYASATNWSVYADRFQIKGGNT